MSKKAENRCIMSPLKVTKTDLVNHLASGMDIGKTQAERIVGMLFREMERKLQEGCAVTLPGIGTLTPFTAQAKKGRNPRTGEACDVPAQRKVKFRLSVPLRQRLNGEEE